VKVFLSSTCYDLIDLRAEVVDHLREQGISVMASDDMQSEFQVHHGVNSIETCLVNVRECDHFVIVLDQRYGPFLGSFGYEGLSATHLEYREALRADKPIHFFVRDRLEADYRFHQKNRGQQTRLPWVKEQHDQNIFSLLEERERSRDLTSNWYSIFRNSLDIKKALSLRFQKIIMPGKLAELINSNRFPLLEIRNVKNVIRGGVVNIEHNFQNITNSPAFGVKYSIKTIQGTSCIEADQSNSIVGPLHLNQVREIKYSYNFPGHSALRADRELRSTTEIVIEYESILGIRVSDKYSFIASIIGSSEEYILKKISTDYYYCNPVSFEIK